MLEIQVWKPIELTIRGVKITGNVIFRKYRCQDHSFNPPKTVWSAVQKGCNVERSDKKPLTETQWKAIEALSVAYTVTDEEFEAEFNRLHKAAVEKINSALKSLNELKEKAEKGLPARYWQSDCDLRNHADVLEKGKYND